MYCAPLIIFTDLDGTLLDHHSYSWQAAQPALRQLRERGIPLILCTSKTAAEVSRLHSELELTTPFIVENGAAIILNPAEDSAHFFGTSHSELIDLVQQLRQERDYRFTGFSDMSVADVVAVTSLDADRAKLAKQRLCSEPILWEDDEEALQKFQQDLAEQNLQLLRGGRFYHVLSKDADKGTALRWLLANYPGKEGCSWHSIALGDGPNDQSMLEAADLAIVIPSATGLSPKPSNVTVIHAEEMGPIGWNRTLLEILK
ncbi:mannosyl-3-phosphoglycerate phosphatase [Malonomonas rubra DSM 5091]|uniref:Mannosyl-3-phosphoglycerate phosphatase n=1 Tax=Malonomonas rubra DSM 5091 TaxID=1122189 RepID=A0A1M6I231_MALRU|nr:HAD-IIB family hydrolase [Malonomonas rubra]SHJ28523.1 mannosyl-3-phosphoglycerate phosphatase [Malonomonas rubra DSM 5091]